jgi:hypothetical protein
MSFDDDLLGAIRRCVPIFLRLTLGVTFLTAAADRFGLWGQFGTPNVAWGDFARFAQYTGQLNPWAPAALVQPWPGRRRPPSWRLEWRFSWGCLPGGPHFQAGSSCSCCLRDEHGNRD